MALIDTSAWIEFFRAKGDPQIKSRVADLVSLHSAAYTCPVRYELMLGAKSHEIADLETGLSFATRISITSDHWDEASKIGASLRLKGFNFPALDLLIATVAHAEKLPLLARDAHFTTIRDQALSELTLIE
ncbi:MAG: PIN domain-containing protein [Luteolibacter sp.]